MALVKRSPNKTANWALYQILMIGTCGGFPNRHEYASPWHRREGIMTLAVRLREDYDARHLRALAKASRDANQTRRLLALAAIYEGGGARRSGPDRRRRDPDGAGLGASVQRGRPGRADQRQGAGSGAAVECRAACSPAADYRSRSEPGGGRGSALAADRSGAVGLCGIRHLDQQADAEPDLARPGLSQALRASAPSRPRPRRSGGV